MSSILESTKKMLGIVPSDTSFDDILVMHINSALQVMKQLGVNITGYISGSSDTYASIFEDSFDLGLAKSYIAYKVRMLFDPPQSSTAMEAMKNFVSECEWRINVSVDPSSENILEA